jgi:hypothetical protein
MKKSTKAKFKRIATTASKAIKRELDYALRDHKLSKKELKQVGKSLVKEAKIEGVRLGAFLKQEFRRELDKALPVVKAYAKHGRKALKKK